MKLFKYALFTLLLSFLFLNVLIVKANTEKTTIVIHYFRYDSNYENSYVHLWEYRPKGKPGKDYKLSTEEDDWGSITKIKLSEINDYSSSNPPTTVGIIIKQGTGWDYKDVPMDRFIDITNPDENGEVHAYFVQGEIPIGTSPDDPNGPDRSNKVLYAYFSTLNKIEFQLTEKLTEDDITLKKDDKVLSGKFSINKNQGSITLDENVDFSKSYQLVVNFSDKTVEYLVTYDGIYDSKEFSNAFYYDGDLGALYTNDYTTFKLWAPISNEVSVCIYDTGAPSTIQTNGDDEGECYQLTKEEKGVWSKKIEGDLHGKYYTYKVTNGSLTHEVIDPYAVSSGVNGIRGMVTDFDRLNPDNWKMSKPDTIKAYTDAIIYELHVRDLTTHSSWNGPDNYRGKFMGLTVNGTKHKDVTTGLDHLVELGITHLHLLPVFDFGVVDETKLDDPAYQKRSKGIFNWGYMPLNFNVPEGSYSTDPYNGEIRVNEFKQMVQALHDNNIRVVMDVVYNHTGLSGDSNFHLIIPGYYHRMTDTGGFSNGSGTGNEMASERLMVRKFMVDSVKLWAKEYNVDGFRFDLMALHDVETMNAISEALHEIDPTIIIYGEPWMGGSSVMDMSISAGKENIKNLNNIAAFNDDIRDGIKGSVFVESSPGFVQGNLSDINRIKYGIAGGINHDDVNFNAWHTSPVKTVNYVSAHDNHTLYDKLIISNNQFRDIIPMHKQANAIVLTSQGIPFLHAGVDFMRTKKGNSNSYEAPDAINQLNWDLKVENIDVFNYYKGLIKLRKSHPALRMTTAQDINDNLTFLNLSDKVIAYQITGYANGDNWEKILVIHNGNNAFEKVTIPEGKWNIVVDLENAGTKTVRTASKQVVLRKNETLVLYQGEKKVKEDDSNLTTWLIIGAISVVIIVSTIGITTYLKRK